MHLSRTEVIYRLKKGATIEASSTIDGAIYLRDGKLFEKVHAATFLSLFRHNLISRLPKTAQTPWYRTDYVWAEVVKEEYKR